MRPVLLENPRPEADKRSTRQRIRRTVVPAPAPHPGAGPARPGLFPVAGPGHEPSSHSPAPRGPPHLMILQYRMSDPGVEAEPTIACRGRTGERASVRTHLAQAGGRDLATTAASVPPDRHPARAVLMAADRKPPRFAPRGFLRSVRVAAFAMEPGRVCRRRRHPTGAGSSVLTTIMAPVCRRTADARQPACLPAPDPQTRLRDFRRACDHRPFPCAGQQGESDDRHV
jgi:hypothetical protein